MAKVEVFRRHRGQSPVLLVDDVDTEIDARRLGRFLEGVGGRSQAVLTSSKLDLFRSPPAEALVYRVRDGGLSPA
jgi:recombinational DNA repair ATPase RecF